MVPMVEVALAGLVAGFAFPVGVVFWSYVFYKLVLKSVKYNVSRSFQALKHEVLA